MTDKEKIRAIKLLVNENEELDTKLQNINAKLQNINFAVNQKLDNSNRDTNYDSNNNSNRNNEINRKRNWKPQDSAYSTYSSRKRLKTTDEEENYSRDRDRDNLRSTSQRFTNN